MPQELYWQTVWRGDHEGNPLYDGNAVHHERTRVAAFASGQLVLHERRGEPSVLTFVPMREDATGGLGYRKFWTPSLFGEPGGIHLPLGHDVIKATEISVLLAGFNVNVAGALVTFAGFTEHSVVLVEPVDVVLRRLNGQRSDYRISVMSKSDDFDEVCDGAALQEWCAENEITLEMT